jgi:putative ABC transport system permease protein
MESLVVIELPKRATSTDANVPLRGVDQGAVRVHDKVRIVRGRNFESGRNEVCCCFVMSQQAILTANLETKF